MIQTYTIKQGDTRNIRVKQRVGRQVREYPIRLLVGEEYAIVKDDPAGLPVCKLHRLMQRHVFNQYFNTAPAKATKKAATDKTASED